MNLISQETDNFTLLTTITYLNRCSTYVVSLAFINKLMDKVAMEARPRPIYVLTVCYLPTFSAQTQTAYSVTGWLYRTLPSVERRAICPHRTWYLSRLGCLLPSSSHHMVLKNFFHNDRCEATGGCLWK